MVEKATGPLPSNKIMGLLYNLICWWSCSLCYENEKGLKGKGLNVVHPNKKQKNKVKDDENKLGHLK